MNSTLLQTSDGRKDITIVVTQYVGQLLNGCGDTACTEQMCYTGLHNNMAGRSTRRYTPRSARAIAVAIASGPSPEKHLCSRYATRRLDQVAGQKDGPSDVSSFLQRLSDTTAVRKLCSPGSPYSHAIGDELVRLHKLLDSLITDVSVQDLESGHAVLSNDRASDVIRDCFRWLSAQTSVATEGDFHFINDSIAHGHAYPTRRLLMPSGEQIENSLSALDSLHDEANSHLLQRMLQAVALRMEHERAVSRLAATAGTGTSVRDEKAGQNLVFLVVQKLETHAPTALACVLHLKKAFLTYWDGEVLLPPRSVALAALNLLAAWSNLLGSESTTLPVVAFRVDAIKLAKAWITTPVNLSHRLLLTYQFLFGPKERAVYFRAINHLRMRNAHSESEGSSELRRRVFPQAIEDMQTNRDAQHYLLLDISRGNVLRDAYNQMWHRRRSHLLRPLRVRLGEIDELEVGHDLGGVQIEMFNLLCKEAFAEERQMFTTDETTGLSYFRPGSLQPLYTCELLGLLFALAIYNGITLPISMPITFYTLLKVLDPAPLVVANVEDVRADWPVMCKSLHSILEQDVGPLEYSFPLEANGLRMEVIHPRAHYNVLKTVTVASVSPNTKHCTTPIHVENLVWPGWKFETSSEEPPFITEEADKKRFVADYLYWLTTGSVEPQLRAFRKGFHAVLDPHLLSIFTPGGLKSLVEGSARLNMDELRKATRYDGYEAKSRYMQSFWRVICSWPEVKQKLLLKFVTAAERIPIVGASDLTFVIQRIVPGDVDHLPTSSTCFGTLRLPRYATPEILNEKLSLAIEYGAEGFGTG